jgi:hypothetical protein
MREFGLNSRSGKRGSNSWSPVRETECIQLAMKMVVTQFTKFVYVPRSAPTAKEVALDGDIHTR